MDTKYNTIKSTIKTCDLILFRAHDIVSNIISKVESFVDGNGEYTHVGMCIRGSSFWYPNGAPFWLNKDKIYILESTMNGTFKSVPDVEGLNKSCVQLRDLDKVIEYYMKDPRNEIGLLKLKDSCRATDIDVESEKLQAEYEKYRGIHYDISPIDLLSTVCPIVRTIQGNRLFKSVRDYLVALCFGRHRDGSNDNDNIVSNWQFCSELVANIYVDLNMLPHDVDPATVIPSDIVVCNEKKHIFHIFEPIISLM